MNDLIKTPGNSVPTNPEETCASNPIDDLEDMDSYDVSLSDISLNAAAAMRQHGILYVDVLLAGGGDEGEADLEAVVFINGKIEYNLPQNNDSIVYIDQRSGQTMRLSHALLHIAQETPEIDWVNNNGGSGTVRLIAFPNTEGLHVEDSVSCHDDDEDFDGDDEDGAGEDLNEEDDDHPLTITMDEVSIHSEINFNDHVQDEAEVKPDRLPPPGLNP